MMRFVFVSYEGYKAGKVCNDRSFWIFLRENIIVDLCEKRKLEMVLKQGKTLVND
ncbi:hypothetical protein [Membranihabitans marinus]|uniref:hypothetical protein n=1 Tax=Membranihabitans marinus TaxID=1227546 RepID=UPI001F34C3ED|nr:hypothetical protein [Membranihabitans marinus]